MEGSDHKNDIRIGKNDWIAFGALPFEQLDKAQDIDGLLEETAALWEHLETVCIAECCGFDAFDFHPEAIIAAANLLHNHDLQSRVQGLIKKVQEVQGDLLISSRLNQLVKKDVFIELLQHISRVLALIQP